MATLTRPQNFTNRLPLQTLISEIRLYENRFQVAEDSQQVTARLLALMEEIPVGAAQVHDANIVATVQVENIQQLLTHNLADFNRFAEIITVLPLVTNS